MRLTLRPPIRRTSSSPGMAVPAAGAIGSGSAELPGCVILAPVPPRTSQWLAAALAIFPLGFTDILTKFSSTGGDSVVMPDVSTSVTSLIITEAVESPWGTGVCPLLIMARPNRQTIRTSTTGMYLAN